MIERDVKIPKDNSTAYGWDFNTYNLSVYAAWTEAVRHGEGHHDGCTKRGYQGGVQLFSNKKLALLALRDAVEEETKKQLAEKLVKIDLAIAKES
jgi:hypothetical protein